MQQMRSPTEANATARPHTPLPDYYGSENQRSTFLKAIFDRTAQDYDRIESVLAFGTGSAYRRSALARAGMAPGHRVLDVGCGTGLVAREALRIVGDTGSVVGVDPSPGMLAQGLNRGATAAAAARIELRTGRAEALPVDDSEFDFVSMGYALRHVADVQAAFNEFHRATHPGGRLLILEITRPQSRLGRGLLKGYMRGIVPLIARVVGRNADTSTLWRYYWDTIDGCIRPDEVLALLARAGFVDLKHERQLGIFSEYTARRA